MEAEKLSSEERASLWKQYAQAIGSAQETFDQSIRTLAAAGLAVTVSLVTALKTIDGWGKAAVAGLVVSLGANLLSYASAQFDLWKRLGYVKASDARGRRFTGWTKVTVGLNVLEGAALFVGGFCLAIYVSTSV